MDKNQFLPTSVKMVKKFWLRLDLYTNNLILQRLVHTYLMSHIVALMATYLREPNLFNLIFAGLGPK